MADKRVRVRGRGADIFFSEDAAPVAETPVATPLSKATFYFQSSQLKRLEIARLTLLRDMDLSADKSEIMRIALEELLKDLETRQENSTLVRRLQARS